MKGSISINPGTLGDPNAGDIIRFVQVEFPEATPVGGEAQLEAIMNEMIGSRQIRQAGRPNPESEVAMRAIVRKCIEQDKPIPVLVVSGPKKPVVGASIDIAEISAMRMLSCLNKRVQQIHAPGVEFRIRLEDITGYYLEGHINGVRNSIEQYITDLTKLLRIFEWDFIKPVRESTLMTEEQFSEKSDSIAGPILEYLYDLEHSDQTQWEQLKSFMKLRDIGWQGTIPPEMRAHYHARYIHLFPESDEDARLKVMSRYFGSTLARYQLGATAVDPSWESAFKINFAAPIPGIPKSLTSTVLYYRTVLYSQSKRHMPYWRTKGVLKLNGKTRISLVPWLNNEDIHPFSLMLHNDTDHVTVQSDYILQT